ncbi:MAG: TIGR01777 family oxidoreductase [Bryobacteraceae bacterium]
MNITITGGTGFIGRKLEERLSADAHKVIVLSRSRGMRWEPMKEEPPAESLSSADAIVHLAGESVGQRWTPEAKAAIRESRVQGTRRLIQGLSTLSRRPAVLVSGSAIGIYGDRGDETLTESSTPGSGFLPELCTAWEREADLAEALGIRVVKLRTGIVLGKGGGALEKMLPPFKAFVGGRLGSGRQWMSWIHIDDLVGLIRFAIDQPLSGPVNGTAPNPVTNAQFTRELASALGRPAIFPAPALALKTLMGEMAGVLLESQKVLPKAALNAGYRFRFPELGPALRDVLGG